MLYIYNLLALVTSCFLRLALSVRCWAEIFLYTAMLCSCIKLEERNIKLVTDCPKCIRMIEDSLGREQGVYWINFQQQTKQLTIKYDTSLISGQELYFFLAKEGLVRTTKHAPLQPKCCQ